MHINALGEKDSCENIKTLSAHAQIDAYGITGQMINHYVLPDRCHSQWDLGPMSGSSGCDGQTVWSHYRGRAIKRNNPKEIASAFNDMYLEGYLYLTKDTAYGRIEVRNDTIINKKNYFQLAMYPKRGDSLYTFINSESGRMEYYFSFEENNLEITQLSDFRRVGGIEMSFHQEFEKRARDDRIIIDIDTIIINKSWPDSIFAIPDLSSISRHHFMEESDSVVVDFKLKKESVILNVLVNGKKKFKFLLDTGAGTTLISEKMAKKLDLKPAGKVTGFGIAGEATSKLSDIDSIRFGDVVWYPDLVYVLDGGNASGDIFRQFDAILGYEFFKEFPVRIDFDRKKIVLYNIENVDPPKTGSAVAINLDNRQAIKEMSLDGRPIKVVIDLAASGQLFLFSNYSWFYKYFDKVRHDPALYESHGIGGYRPVKTGRAEYLKFDDIFIANPEVDMAYRPEGFKENLSSEALLGIGILKRYNLLIDYPNSVIYFDIREKYKDR